VVGRVAEIRVPFLQQQGAKAGGPTIVMRIQYFVFGSRGEPMARSITRI
jgi:hypothetical protein